MLYVENSHLKYTDMCIYIDNNVYTDDRDENKIFNYLVELAFMLAHKHNYFTTHFEYTDFSVYFATEILLRLLSEKQYGDNPKLTKIKSVLNYMKASIYGYKVKYQQLTYKEYEEVEEEETSDRVYYCSLIDSSSALNKVDFVMYLDDIPRTIRNSIKNISFKRDKVMFHKIYVSCLLTFLNHITLPNSQKKKTELINRDVMRDARYEFLLNTPIKDSVILYQLPDTFTQYIAYLVNKVRLEICTELRQLLTSQVDIETRLQDIFPIYENSSKNEEY